MKIQHGEILPRHGCLAKHDTIGDIVEDEIQDRLDMKTFRDIEYEDPHFRGEIDVYACRPGYLLLAEVKSTDGESQYLKARQQLARAHTHIDVYGPQSRVFTAYAAAGPDDDIYLNWIPRRDLPNKYTRQLPKEKRRMTR